MTPEGPVPQPRVAVIGLGSFGQQHLSALLQAGVEPVAVADPDPLAVARAAERVPAAQRFADGLDLIEGAAVDAVTIATPGESHVDLALAAAGRGLHVLVEKPVASTLSEVDRLAAAGCGDLIMPGHVLRFDPAHRALRAVVVGGGLGRVVAISSTRDRDRGHLAYGEQDPVFLTQVHDLDLAGWLDGSLPEAVTAIGPEVNGQSAIVATQAISTNGVVWSLWASYLLPLGDPGRDRLEIFGDQGAARLTVDGAGSHLWTSVERGRTHSWPRSVSALREEIDTFLRSVRTGRSIEEITLAEAIAVMRIAVAVRASRLAGGRPVPVEGAARQRRSTDR